MLSSTSLLTSVVALGMAVIAYGVASLLQAMAARRGEAATPGGLLLSPLVLGGLVLDVVGFLCGAVALHDLPLFFVQGASAASILVTALLASVVLGERPDRSEAVAMPLVFVGLIGLAAAAEPGAASALPMPLVGAMLLAVPLFAVLARRCWASTTRRSALGLALLAGLAYGTASLAARGLSAPGQSSTLIVPVGIVVVAHALLGVTLVTAAMHRLPVNTVTSVLFATETVAPAAIGLLWLGDRTGAGMGPVALGGCLCIVLATGLLSRASDGVAAGRRRPVPAVNLLAGRPARFVVPKQRTALPSEAVRPIAAGRHRSS